MAHLVLAEVLREPAWVKNSIAPVTTDLGFGHLRGEVGSGV
jgi:hypothetical protein